MERIAAIDIGSTYTKGILLNRTRHGFDILERAATPTTRNELSDGFHTVLNQLHSHDQTGSFKTFCSSSAKGGLSIAAIGIVPDITLKMARLTACSAGGKIDACFSYKLTDQDVDTLEKLNPDIILFSGGTDGGNETYPLFNAEVLNHCAVDSVILYSGNRTVADQVKTLLSQKNVVITENILPEMQRGNPEPARAEIQKLFLEQIISGKGLASVQQEITGNLAATPYRVFEFLKTLSESLAEWRDTALIDLGGATTDVYSLCENRIESEEIHFKGIPEPQAKRTVEGDLGMRVSAGNAWSGCGEEWFRHYAPLGDVNEYDAYFAKVADDPGFIPDSAEILRKDQFLASLCVGEAMTRHCGTREKMYISTGAVMVQRGKNLASVSKVIGSGGFLASQKSYDPLQKLKKTNNEGHSVLLPESFEYIADHDYLLPLAANIAVAYPVEAACWFTENLLPVKGE